MPYWILNKQTNEPKVFGSLPPVSKYTGISKNQLRVVFSDKKKTEFENDEFRICRLEMERGGGK